MRAGGGNVNTPQIGRYRSFCRKTHSAFPLFHLSEAARTHRVIRAPRLFFLKGAEGWGRVMLARAHGLWTYEPRQGRKAATVVCSASAVVTLAFGIHGIPGHSSKVPPA